MKKFFKWFFIIVGSLAAIYLIAALFLPSSYRVERSKTMAASPAVVYEQVANLEKWSLWSPWEKADPTMKATYEGTPGTVGSKMLWDGDPEKSGKGSIEITELVPNQKVTYKLTFIDWEMTSSGTFLIDSLSADSTKLTWFDEGEIGYLFRPMCAMMLNHDEMMGPDFVKGLNSIDSVAQIRQAEIVALMFPTYDVQKVSLPPVHYVGVRYDTLISAVDSVLFGTAYTTASEYIALNKLQMAGAPVCITYSWDEVAGRCELVAAIPVLPAISTAKLKPIGSVEWITFEAKDAIVVDYYGDYMDIWKAHSFLEGYTQENNLNVSLSIEEYVTDPTTVSTYDSVLTKLYYHVEK